MRRVFLGDCYLEHGKVIEHPLPEGRDVQEADLVRTLVVIPKACPRSRRSGAGRTRLRVQTSTRDRTLLVCLGIPPANLLS